MLDDPDAPLPELMEEALLKYRKALTFCDRLVDCGKINGEQRRETLLRIAKRLELDKIAIAGQGPNHTFKENAKGRRARLETYRSKWEKELAL